MIGQVVKEARIARGITLESLAEEIGISVSQLSRFENGKRDIKVDELLKIAKVLNIQIGSLIDEQLLNAVQMPPNIKEIDVKKIQDAANIVAKLSDTKRQTAVAILNSLLQEQAESEKK
jgi:transcriptional regulator with XRE-family HTH domain